VTESKPDQWTVFDCELVLLQKFGVHALGIGLALGGSLTHICEGIPERLDGSRQLRLRILGVDHELVVRVVWCAALSVTLEHCLDHVRCPWIAVAPHVRLADTVTPGVVRVCASRRAVV